MSKYVMPSGAKIRGTGGEYVVVPGYLGSAEGSKKELIPTNVKAAMPLVGLMLLAGYFAYKK
jgi:hypothetical protein